jgi:hypothetical protein
MIKNGMVDASSMEYYSETRDYWITYNVGALFDENSQ